MNHTARLPRLVGAGVIVAGLAVVSATPALAQGKAEDSDASSVKSFLILAPKYPTAYSSPAHSWWSSGAQVCPDLPLPLFAAAESSTWVSRAEPT
jgi:hypothetical protein